MGLGTIGARAIADIFNWPTHVSAIAIALAFGCSAVVGIFFGYYPARQASQLDPSMRCGSNDTIPRGRGMVS